ncbi:MAG TPA: hypothetical protein VMA75_00845 [Candidatus Paceibacterota bacterium]|nr:hypothetical protein [Candidatus Paceibacterota bacterium]
MPKSNKAPSDGLIRAVTTRNLDDPNRPPRIEAFFRNIPSPPLPAPKASQGIIFDPGALDGPPPTPVRQPNVFASPKQSAAIIQQIARREGTKHETRHKSHHARTARPFIGDR